MTQSWHLWLCSISIGQCCSKNWIYRRNFSEGFNSIVHRAGLQCSDKRIRASGLYSSGVVDLHLGIAWGEEGCLSGSWGEDGNQLESSRDRVCRQSDGASWCREDSGGACDVLLVVGKHIKCTEGKKDILLTLHRARRCPDTSSRGSLWSMGRWSTWKGSGVLKADVHDRHFSGTGLKNQRSKIRVQSKLHSEWASLSSS